MVFEIAKNGSGYNAPVVLTSFDQTDGSEPSGGLIMDSSGDLFGTTRIGGAFGDGEAFEIVKTSSGYASTPTVLASFNGSDGAVPPSALVVDAAGDLFGTTQAGGAFDDGVAFEIAKASSGYASTPTVLASFDGADGDAPYDASLVVDAAGDLFGTAHDGGAFGDGVAFEIAKTSSGYASTPTVLASLNGTDGDCPIPAWSWIPRAPCSGPRSSAAWTNDGVVFELLPETAEDNTTSVNVATPGVAPTITGAVANQTLTVGSTDTPFSHVTIGDANAKATDTLTITLTGRRRARRRGGLLGPDTHPATSIR